MRCLMNPDKEYISIAEFAEQAGVSKQAVYQRLNKSLKAYVKVVDGKKSIDIRALEDLNKFFKAKFKGLNKALKRKKRVS